MMIRISNHFKLKLRIKHNLLLKLIKRSCHKVAHQSLISLLMV